MRLVVLCIAMVVWSGVCVAQQANAPGIHALGACGPVFGACLVGGAGPAQTGKRSGSQATQPSQAKPSAPLPRQGMWAGNPARFFQGAFAAFVGHETGHLIANGALNTDLYTMPVHYGPIPFFTIQPGRPLTNREHYITASAGFNAQHIINEWVLTKHPNLMRENQPTLKGLASFNFWLTVGYAASAFACTGPEERDTKGMADSLGWNERWIGAMILVPTALDTYRYKHPESKWAPTASRLSKLAIIFLAAKAHGE